MYPSASHYGDSVPVKIFHSKGTDVKLVNQQKNGGEWISLGKYNFDKGKKLSASIIGERGEYVIADAMKFVFIHKQQ
jgi:hypothetical protein